MILLFSQGRIFVKTLSQRAIFKMWPSETESLWQWPWLGNLVKTRVATWWSAFTQSQHESDSRQLEWFIDSDTYTIMVSVKCIVEMKTSSFCMTKKVRYDGTQHDRQISHTNILNIVIPGLQNIPMMFTELMNISKCIPRIINRTWTSLIPISASKYMYPRNSPFPMCLERWDGMCMCGLERSSSRLGPWNNHWGVAARSSDRCTKTGMWTRGALHGQNNTDKMDIWCFKKSIYNVN